MPKSKHRVRICQFCSKKYVLGEESTQHKYCSVVCRSSYHYNRWKSNGGMRCKEKTKAYYLKHHYNITRQDFENLLKSQNYCCAICKRDTPVGSNWHIDHCHFTNKIRGLLCSKCNQGLGLFEDNINSLKEAIKYLENQ